MRGRWLKFENKHAEQVIVGRACAPTRVFINITLWLLLAGLTMSLTGCTALLAVAIVESIPEETYIPIATFREGTVQPPASWPITTASSKQSISLLISGVRIVNGHKEFPTPRGR